MEQAEPKLNKLQALLHGLVEDTLTKEDFVHAFEQVVETIKTVQKRNDSEIVAMHKSIELLAEQVANDSKTDLDSFKAELQSAITKKMADLDTKMAAVSDGEDGNDADEESVVKQVLARIPAPDLQSLRDEIDARFEELDTKMGQAKERTGGVTVFGPGKTRVIVLDLSSQLDGATKTFRIGTNFGIVGVSSSGAPFGAFRPVIDYDGVGPNIVFTASVDAPTALATGGSLIITYLR